MSSLIGSLRLSPEPSENFEHTFYETVKSEKLKTMGLFFNYESPNLALQGMPEAAPLSFSLSTQKNNPSVMAKILKFRSPLEKKIKAGFRGYPIATIAFYGPNNTLATKVAVGIVLNEVDKEASKMEKWFSEKEIRTNTKILKEIKKFLTDNKARSVVATNAILGCPHEEGIDYPENENCSQCPFWANRDRFIDELKE